MIKVRLLGELGKKYGKSHMLAIKSPAEAVRALCANFPDFERFLSTSGDRGVSYRVIADRDTINEQRLHDPIGKSLTIAPVIHGAKGGLIQTIVGAVIVAVAFVASFTPLAPISPFLYTVGVSMMIGGVAQMLSPQPQTTAASNGTESQSGVDPSYVFNGAVNTNAQGHPVPVGYGRMIVGSAVISAGIVTEEII